MRKTLFRAIAVVIIPLTLFGSLASAQIGKITPPGGSASTPTATTISTATTCVDAGASDTYACNLPAAPTLADGLWAAFKANTANTGAATINFNSTGALSIKRKTTTITTDLITGDIRAGQWVLGYYDGTNFQCVSCDGSVAYYNTPNTFTGGVTLGTSNYLIFGGPAALAFKQNTVQTPDTGVAEVGTLSNVLHVFESGDTAFDFNNGACGTSACTDPGFVIHSSAQDTTQYSHQSVWGNAGGSIKALTAAAATALVRIPVAQGSGTGGSLRYTVYATDATDFQIREGEIKFAVVNKAGTETCTVSAASEAADGSVAAVSAGTLTYAITCASNAADTVDLMLNAVSSLVETTLNATYRVTLVGPGQPARQ